MSKKDPDTSAADEEAQLSNQQYAENELEIEEKRKAIDQMEMSFLHSQGGLQFDTSVPPDKIIPPRPAPPIPF